MERERGAPLLLSQWSGSGSAAPFFCSGAGAGSAAPFLAEERERERRSFSCSGAGAGAALQI